MRVLSQHLGFNHHPLDGRGAALYVGVGPEDGSDPGPDSVVFRKLRILPRKWIRGSGFSIGDGCVKTALIATTSDPTAALTYSVPEAWHGRIVYVQVRTWWNCCENIHNTDPLRLDFTDDGELDQVIHGTGTIIAADKRDGGIYRIRAAYYQGLGGTEPTTILIRQTAGPGSLADVETDYIAGKRVYDLDTAELTDGEEYTFAFLAAAGAVELILDSITFTADNAGPPSPTGLALTAT